MNIYYVYAYLRKSDNTPYYIGKGKNKRAITKHHGVSVPADRTKIIYIEMNLTDVGACAIERWLIRWYGRKDLGTGILLNKTDGGEGAAGYIMPEISRQKLRVPKSESTRKKMSDAKKGKFNSNSRYGTKLGDITKEKISAIHKNKIVSTESKLKMSISQKARSPISDITREKLRIAATGRKVSDETRVKLSKPRTEEAKQRMRESQSNRPQISEETREKMRESARKRCRKSN